MNFGKTLEEIKKWFYIILSSLIYAIAINWFIVPMGLYSGGILGTAQVIRTIIERYLNISFSFDISGIISFLINIPLLMLTYKSIGRDFVIKTAVCIVFQSGLLTIIPIKILIDDYLTSSIIGGILCGSAIGCLLKFGGSSGGVDIIGMYITKKSKLSVGMVSLIMDIFVYAAVFLLLLDIEKIIYTLIFAAINMIAVDKMHTQNINSEVIIISKNNNREIQTEILLKLRRGVSYWDGYGAFTTESNRILYTIISKYELSHLKKIVLSIDPKAFISINNDIDVIGNFEKRL